MDALPRSPRWRRYLRFWRPDVAADVDDELRFHLNSRIEELVAAGTPEADATARAIGEMGDVAAIRTRLTTIDQRVLRRRSAIECWRLFVLDGRYALRRLRLTPGFTIAAATTMVIAIGATASVFALVDGVLLKAFPYRDPARVLAIWEYLPAMHFPRYAVSPADYLAYAAQNKTFAALAAAQSRLLTAGGAHEPEAIQGLTVTPSYFQVLGITPALGRPLSRDSSGPPEVVIGNGYWHRRFGAAVSVLGQTLLLDGQPYIIVGVMPAGLAEDSYVAPVDAWIRLSFSGADERDRNHHLTVQGRLQPGETPERAHRDLNTIARRLGQVYPKSNAGWSVVTAPLLDRLVGPVRPALLLLMGASACVLLIGAANLANLFLVRFLARDREIGLRAALGASRARIAREFMAEATILGLGAGAIGVGGAFVGVHTLRTLAPTTLPRVTHIGVDARVVAVCVLVSIVTVIVFGVVPAWQASGDKSGYSLNEGSRTTASARQRRLQHALVVVQLAAALVLLTGASLLVTGFEHFRRMNLGFRPEGVMTAFAWFPLPHGGNALATPADSTLDRQHLVMAQIVERLARLPGVRHASASTSVPTTRGFQTQFAILGAPPLDPAEEPRSELICASPGYFRTMGMTLLRGRGILPSDQRRTQQVVVADEVLAQQFFGGRDPVGQRLLVPPDTALIVGLVAPVKQYGYLDETKPALFAPLTQCPLASAFVAIRTDRDPETQTAAIKQAIAVVDPTVVAYDFQTLSARMGASISTLRFASFLASLFAVIAVMLGLVGIYSVIAYVVNQRRREIAVRIALGARRTDIMRAIIPQAVVLAGTGVALGIGAAWVLMRVLVRLIEGVSPHDAAALLGSAAVFTVAALAAASIPAIRMTRIDPVVALTST